MKLVRRDLISMAGLALAAGAPAAARAQEDPADTLTAFGFVGPEDDPVFGPRITGKTGGGSAVGTGPARHDEVAHGFRLLFDAPRVDDHMRIARYFAAISDKNGEGEPYNREWKTRANPLIVGFFSMTNTKPALGDQTSWCAAFVSFCLQAAGKDSGFNALSGAYRRYGDPTDHPVPGDIVVFADNGERGRQGFGHVGFYLGVAGGRVSVLGGNQVGDTGSTGAVTTTSFPLTGGGLQVHSYRRVK